MQVKIRNWKTRSIQVTLGWLMLLSGCNAFTSLDAPTGDPQILSAARACFNAGNFTCATSYYLQLSTTAYRDTQNTELAYDILAQKGITAPVFISAVLSNGGNFGGLITQLAGQLSYHASRTNRLALFQAYQYALVIQNTQAQQVMRFITALALVAEIFSENTVTPGNYKQSDLVTNPAGCSSASLLTVATTPATCAIPATSTMITGLNFGVLSTAGASSFAGAAPTLYMINACISEIANTANSLSSGLLGSSASDLATTITSQLSTYPIVSYPSVFLYLLLKQLGIGNTS